jgi:carbon-monoxide dehydrogenase medium subunit
MKAAPFTLHRPRTLADAVRLMAEVADEGGLVLAGGQSLTPMMALRVAYPPHLVDINMIESLARIAVEGDHLLIGATVRHAEFHRPNPEFGALGELLAEVAHNIAHYPIRQRGTFCGSLAHADPASEWCLVAVTLGAALDLKSVSGERSVAASEFVDGAMSTTREPEEILAEVRLPLLSEKTRFGFYEFNRRAGDFALGMALAVYELEDGLIRNPRIGIGGIEERARRISAVEAILEGEEPSAAVFERAAAAAAEAVDPMEDVTTTADYRRDLSRVVVKRALEASVAATQQANRASK